MPDLVILGAGTAGTMLANRLRAPLARRGWRITVVDRDDEHHYQPGYLFIPFGTYDRAKVVRSRHAFLPDGVELVLAEVAGIDVAAHAVRLADGRQLPFDQLVVATGCTPRPDLVPGLPEAMAAGSATEFYTLAGAERTRAALERFTGGRLVVHVAELPIKCPVAPLEFALLAEDWLAKRGLRERTELVYVTPLDGAFTRPVAKRELGHLLDSRGIAIEPDFLVEGLDHERRVLQSYDGRDVAFDLLVSVPPNAGADVIKASGLGDDLGYVPVDKHTLRATAHPEVWALGDASNIPTSKAGSVAHFAAEVLAANLLEVIDGGEPTHGFDGHANCFVESGRGKGMLLDFNYETEPLTGTFPLPGVGPMALLKESRANHLGKLAFREIYWNVLLPGRPLPISNALSMAGKRVEAGAEAGPPPPAGDVPADTPIVPTF